MFPGLYGRHREEKQQNQGLRFTRQGKPVIESCCGYNLITDEKLAEFERSLNVVFAVADLITLVTGITAFVKAAETVGAKEAASYMGKQFMVELSADASAAGVAAIGGDRQWPSCLVRNSGILVYQPRLPAF